ncbi:class I SAM-dependent methyltransferase [Nocardia paucivorans]|uniref:class I SAM-dependent methyltransferase n=1 Tax=Nocardia paucivorans TaxID=114259 RepID=UPI00278BC57A|nr:methyltransferase domain-containing protein [Nocardia paucivorans]
MGIDVRSLSTGLLRSLDFMSTLSRRLSLMAKETVQKRQPADDLIALLDTADRLPSAVALRARSYDLLNAGPGTSAVDVGCGAGRAVAELAERGVRAIGVDPSEPMLAAARSRWPEADFRNAGA